MVKIDGKIIHKIIHVTFCNNPTQPGAPKFAYSAPAGRAAPGPRARTAPPAPSSASSLPHSRSASAARARHRSGSCPPPAASGSDQTPAGHSSGAPAGSRTGYRWPEPGPPRFPSVPPACSRARAASGWLRWRSG